MTGTTRLVDDGKLSHTIDGASDATGIPKSTLWKYIKDGELATYKVGRRRLIPHDALRRLLTGGAA